MKHKQPTPANLTMRSIGTLAPTSNKNRRRKELSEEDRFTLLCMVGAVVMTAILVAVGF